MHDSILVPLDGSDFSEDAIPMARRVARELGARLHLVHVIFPARDADLKSPAQDMEWKDMIRDGAESYLSDLARTIEEDGIETETAVLEGRTVDALDDYIIEEDIPLVVMTTHGAGGFQRWWLGSVADRLLARGNADFLLVRPWDDTEERPRPLPRFARIVVPLDGSEDAETALEPARELQSRFGSELTLLRVVPAPLELTSIYGVRGVRVEGEGHRRRFEEAEAYLREAAARLGDPPPEILVFEHGGVAEGVIVGAKRAGGDLLVLSSHGRGGLERAVIGSVADKVIRGTTLPVLVVRVPEAE